MSTKLWIGTLALGAALAAQASHADDAPRLRPPGAPGDAAPVAPPSSEDAWIRFGGQSLRYEEPRFQGDAKLFVLSAARSAQGSTGWQVHRGTDLEAIVRANPSLASHPELASLRAQIAGPSGIRIVVQGYTLGFEHDPLTGEGRLFHRGQRGGESMWSGNDLDAIAAENPEVTRIQEFADLQTRVRNVNPAGLPVSMRPGASGVVEVAFAPQGVTVTLHEGRNRRWNQRAFQGRTLTEVFQRQPDLARILEFQGMPSQPLPEPGAYPGNAPKPAPRPAPNFGQPRPGGGGAACGGGGKSCG